jgi:hypothetical protein
LHLSGTSCFGGNLCGSELHRHWAWWGSSGGKVRPGTGVGALVPQELVLEPCATGGAGVSGAADGGWFGRSHSLQQSLFALGTSAAAGTATAAATTAAAGHSSCGIATAAGAVAAEVA